MEEEAGGGETAEAVEEEDEEDDDPESCLRKLLAGGGTPAQGAGEDERVLNLIPIEALLQPGALRAGAGNDATRASASAGTAPRHVPMRALADVALEKDKWAQTFTTWGGRLAGLRTQFHELSARNKQLLVTPRARARHCVPA